MAMLLKNSTIKTPSQKFVDRFKQIFGIDLLDGSWHDRMFSLQQGAVVFPILKFDRWLSRQDAEYDFDAATYRGVATSMDDYLIAKYGEEGNSMVTYLTQNDDLFETEFDFA